MMITDEHEKKVTIGMQTFSWLTLFWKVEEIAPFPSCGRGVTRVSENSKHDQVSQKGLMQSMDCESADSWTHTWNTDLPLLDTACATAIKWAIAVVKLSIWIAEEPGKPWEVWWMKKHCCCQKC